MGHGGAWGSADEDPRITYSSIGSSERTRRTPSSSLHLRSSDLRGDLTLHRIQIGRDPDTGARTNPLSLLT